MIARHHTRRGGGRLETFIGTLGCRKFGFGLSPLQVDRLSFGFRFGDLRLHLRCDEGSQQLALFNNTASIHLDLLDKAAYLGVNGNTQVRAKFTRKLHLSFYDFRVYPGDFNRDLGLESS